MRYLQDDHPDTPFDAREGAPASKPDLLDVFSGVPGRVVGPRRVTNDAPDTVDLVHLGSCQYRCKYCWGPTHDRPAVLTPADHVMLMRELAQAGVRHVVHTGGETLANPRVGSALHHARLNGLRNTLSTNGLLLMRNGHLLDYIDDLGVALDGPTAEVHYAMRDGAERHDGFNAALRAMQYAQRATLEGWCGSLTVRTVVAKRNLDAVVDMPEALQGAGLRLEALRLKLYQVEPIGPHVGAIDFDGDWAVGPEEVEAVGAATAAAHPEMAVDVQLYADTPGRYFLIGPDGTITGTDIDSSGKPFELEYGHALDLRGAIGAWRSHNARLRARGLLKHTESVIDGRTRHTERV